MNNNASLTTFTNPNEYVDCNFGTITDSNVSSQMILVDAQTAEYQYDPDASRDFVGKKLDVVSGFKSGSTENYQFALSINNSQPTFTAIASTAVTSVTDSGGNARFNFTPGPTILLNQILTLTGFAETSYNVVGQVSATGAGFFELTGVTFVANDTGNFESPADFFIPMEVKTTKVQATVPFPLRIKPGDKYKLKVAAVGTTNAITLSDYFTDGD
jgi:hypothetical protein